MTELTYNTCISCMYIIYMFSKIEISLIHHIHTFYNSVYFCTNTSSRLIVRIFTHTTFTDMVSSGAVCKIRFVTTLSTTLLFMKNTQNALYCNIWCASGKNEMFVCWRNGAVSWNIYRRGVIKKYICKRKRKI